MIHEIATLTVDPASADAFEAAVRQAKPLFLAAEGCSGMRLERVIEVPGRYLLRVDWGSVEAHMDVFRNSPAFQEWRAVASPFFVEAPQVVHSQQVV